MKVHALQTGAVRIKTAQRQGRGHGIMRQVNILRDQTWTPWLPIYAWVIEHPDGLILVDTGGTAQALQPGYLPQWHPYTRTSVQFDVSPEQEVGPQLQAIGLHPQDVRLVILTHLHMDHDGGLQHFPKSTIMVQHDEYQRAKGIMGQLRGYLPQHWPAWFRPQPIPFVSQAYGPFADHYPVTSDHSVLVVPTPGHTPHHVSVIVQATTMSYFLAGDTSYTQHLLLEQQVDGVSPNEAVAATTLTRIRTYGNSTPTVYVPSHDPEAAQRLAQQQAMPQR